MTHDVILQNTIMIIKFKNPGCNRVSINLEIEVVFHAIVILLNYSSQIIHAPLNKDVSNETYMAYSLKLLHHEETNLHRNFI